MVRETRHLWVGNLPDNIREDRIREHFKRYGRVQSVKLLPRGSSKEEASKMACTVAFMDIKSASKAHTADHKLDDRTLTTEYYEPAAIPSSSSPPSVATGYSTTSPSNARFPNGHSSSDEHSNFTECFYERTNNSRQPASDSEYIRRPPSYHDNGRGRNRERGFRNGPYKLDLMERHRTVTNAWAYDGSSRYNSQANDTGYSTTPTDTSSNNDRRSEQSTKKKSKSATDSRTPSPSGSISSRSPSRSRSRSSSSSTSSSVSRGTSSTGSPKSRRLQSSNANQTIVHSEDRRPLAICVRNLPLRSSDTSLKDGLFHEYKKHGKVTWVKVVGLNSERHAIVCFKKPEDAEKAIEVSYDKLFFGCKIEVAPYQGYDVEDNDLRPYEAEIDEYHPKATRTLFIGNLEKDITASDLRKNFDQFGEIIEIDIKKQGSASSYAFCQYSDIVSVVKAIRTMDGEHLNNNRIKLGFGKSMPTTCVWVDGISDNVNDKYLSMQFDPFGNVGPIFIDREKGQALIFFDQVINAQTAVNKTRGVSLRGRRIQVDFASRECQEAFFENLEKQGLTFERPVDDRRDILRGFDGIVSGRFSRYDTPTRPRTASYSGRSGGPGGGQCQGGALPSPGTPGSATPRGAGSRSRVPRYEYYDQNNAEYSDRHFRNYDEYSQGSAASHEDTYDHDYPYHESPSHLDALVNDPILVQPFVQPDIRNLQKERVHLLEQLEDCHSSGDEVISPKKRLKLDHIDGSNDVIIEANRDHRKVTEVRRSSDVSLKHISRRPSVDSGKHSHDRNYLPHAVCKRRKTAGSDSGRHHYESSESISGSRPGTPLCDERPEHFTPSEPRRVPREREGPLTLPLPRFASQMIGRVSVSIAGIKGQKENVLSSPPAAVTSPRISNPKPPSPMPVPPPASPPPRPPSLSSNSSDSDGASPSPSLDERIKSLDEKYEKWSGSRAMSTAGLEALAKLDTTSQRFRLTRNLLDLDLKEVQPSEIVKSVMAKRSVFDEDSKRLENVGEKYEPKDFNSVLRVTPVSVQTSVPVTTLSTLPLLKVCTTPASRTPTMLSPRSSSGAALTSAKGLQYPFPSHPPMQPSPSSSTSSTSSLTTQPPTSTTSSSSRSTHGENRLKSCANVPNENTWTPSKVNRSVSSSSSSSSAGGTIANPKSSDSNAVPLVSTNAATVSSAAVSRNIPPASFSSNSSCTSSDCITTTTTKMTMCAHVASGSARRDSSASSNSGENRSRRNSVNENCDSAEVDRLEKARLESERIEREGVERERLERERTEKERMEKERLEREEKERLERERLEKERAEKERIERERRLERERKEREEKERREREENERREREEKEEHEREEKEEREREERDQHDREEKERRELEERERCEKERREREERDRKEELERLEKERRRLEKEEERKQKEDNHDNKKLDHRYNNRDNHSETKHNRENNVSATSKEQLDKNHISCRNTNEKCRSGERDPERRKDNAKEARDNDPHEKTKNTFCSEVREIKDRTIEAQHLSGETKIESKDPSRRKDRTNSMPASVTGSKRRISAHDLLDNPEETKKIKIDRMKVIERRDSKDTNVKKHSKNASASVKMHEEKQRHNNLKENTTNTNKEKDRERDDKHKSKNKMKTEQKSQKIKTRDKDSPTSQKSPIKELDRDFLARLDLVEVEKQKHLQRNKETSKEERKIESRSDDNRTKKDKCIIDSPMKQVKEEKTIRRLRKLTNSSENSDSDEPKKHSIFDIVVDEPAYISMYDKVKARSCKNMQKQEEEKRQEKIKAKFSQLKQSRAKREEKKRSTSWDEDSDSEVEKIEKTEYSRRKSKIIIASSEDDEECGQETKKDFSDSDSDRIRQVKSLADSSDDDIKNAKLLKTRITSDTSDDEHKPQTIVKTEEFTDNEDQGFADSEEKYSKKVEFETRYVKKERKNNKHCDLSFDMDTPMESKEVKFNNRNRLYDSSADECVKVETRKKHKKKQKRSKNSTSGEESSKLDELHEKQVSDKRKQHSKKEKKRDKALKEERGKKSKKNRSDSKEYRRDGKMENIFGSLSDDSDPQKEMDEKIIYVESFSENNETLVPTFASDSDTAGVVTEQKSVDRIQIDKEMAKAEEKERFLKEEHRKRKEKKRRDKEKRLREEQQQLANENSVDYSDLGKQLEDNIKDDSDPPEEIKIKTEIEDTGLDVDESYHQIEIEEKTIERKEGKEKKKKRKKSKDEKQRHHHHHHHHDKNKPKTPEIKKELVALDTPIKTEADDETTSDITAIPGTSIFDPSSHDVSISPQTSDNGSLISPISQSTTSSKEKKRDRIPGFGVDIDEKIHENENAVKTISDLSEATKLEPSVVPSSEEEIKIEPSEQPVEEKPPRVVISQEETEDAVAALLGESFGSGQFEEYEPQSPAALEQGNSETQDDEEMLQAVQSLNSSELEIKPDTPQSEHDLQIDTDTEETEDISIRYDTPKTPEMMDYSQPPKTPDIPSYFRKENAEKNVPSIGSPPSLTPIKTSLLVPERSVLAANDRCILSGIPEVKQSIGVPSTVTPKIWPYTEIESEPKSMPPLAIPMPTQVILQSKEVKEVALPSPPPLKPVSVLPVTTHNMPAQLPAYPVPKEIKSCNRLPISAVVVPKSTQATTNVLTQSKPTIEICPPYGQMLPQQQQQQLPTPARSMILQRPPGLFIRPPYLGNVYEKSVNTGTLHSEPPKLASLSAPLLLPTRPTWHHPQVSADLPKLVPTGSSPTSPSGAVPPPVPAIIISQPPSSGSTFMPVIQETSKAPSPQQPATQFASTPTPPPTQSLIIKQLPQEDEETKHETYKSDFLRVADTTRTSTPSPVIVGPIPKGEEAVTSTTISSSQDSPVTLAIETVTEELNLSLKKADEDAALLEGNEETEDQEEPSSTVDDMRENISVIKETDNLDEDEIESKPQSANVVEMGTSQSTRSTLVQIDNAAQNEDSKEDGDCWSADVNIDSVIQKVDALCSADLPERTSATAVEEWIDVKMEIKQEKIIPEEKEDVSIDDVPVEQHEIEVATRGKRGGRGRGKSRGSTRGGMQTRRGKGVTATQGNGRGRGRGGRGRGDRKITKSESEDVYEFHDDSDENKDRPRLIMTIKGAIVGGPSGSVNAQTVVKEVITPPKDPTPPAQTLVTESQTELQPPIISREQPSSPTVFSTQQVVLSPPVVPLQPQPVLQLNSKDEFALPAHTRKSRRLQERDVSRNTVDDTIEDVVKNTILTRAAAAAAAANTPRRSARQTIVAKQVVPSQGDTNRKSPRGAKKKDRRLSETADDSSEEKSIKIDPICKREDGVEDTKDLTPRLQVVTQNIISQVEPCKLEVREKPHEGLKAAMLRRVKGEIQQQQQQEQQQRRQMQYQQKQQQQVPQQCTKQQPQLHHSQHQQQNNAHEAQTLIDPVTGLLMPMLRECEEGRYIPISAQKTKEPQTVIASQHHQSQQNKQISNQTTIIPTQGAIHQPQILPPVSSSVLVKQKPLSLKARVLSQANAQQQLQQHQQLPLQLPVQNQPIMDAQVVSSTNPAVYSSNKPLNINVSMPYDIPAHVSPRNTSAISLAKSVQGVKVIQPPLSPIHVKQHHIIQVVKPQPQLQQQQQLAKTTPNDHSQMVHINQPTPIPQSSIIKHAVSQPSISSSPPVKHIISTVSPGRIIPKTVMEPPKVDVSIASGCVMVPRSNASPQGRHMIPVAAYEASMQHGDNRRRSPPPAHQNSPSPQGEGIAHYTPGAVRLPHDIHSPYIHPTLYQQYIRQQSFHMPRNSHMGLEKPDSQEGEEAPLTSPPLELRRPGSVGMGPTGRPNVPHSLQSPMQDRTTESPQIAQVFGIPRNRVQLGRYYDSAEPPPAHRPLTSHSTLAALGSERPLGHMGTLPDRPLSTHSALASHIGIPERPLSTHIPERPMSTTHIPDRTALGLGAVLGAAGNIMGAVARHVGDAPASQRGIQAATPPHASQVPPQAESLLMLLKQYPLMWQGLLALKNDQAAVQMYFVSGNDHVAKMSLPKNIDGTTPPLRIFQRMRLEPPQVEGVARKMQMENEHCMLLALPCGHDHMDVLKQSTNLTNGFITYLQHKQAAGIVNVAAPGTTQPPAYVVHIFPSCDFVNENLRRIAPSLLERVADIAHLLIVITTV